jgi:predicted RNA binding protein YcfA (HicA-like mRNA interferase family)
MSKRSKLREKVLNSNSEISFQELLTFLTQSGFEQKSVSGSHRIFGKEGVEEIINVQPHKTGKAKPYQIRQIREIFQKYNL